MELLKNFPNVTPKQWKQQIQFELNGLDYNKTFLWENSGINVKPFYTVDDVNYTKKNDAHQNKVNFEESITDVVTEFAKNGSWKKSKKEDFKNIESKLLLSNTITIDCSFYADAGANIVQQLAYCLAIVYEYLMFFGKERNLNFQFKFSVGDNYFFEIAKLYSVHFLWKQFLSNLSISFAQVPVLVTHNSRNKINAKIDELPFVIEDICFRNSTEVIAGNYYIENLSTQLIDKSYNLYELIKNNGGFIEQLKIGNIQRKIKEVAQRDKYNPKIVKNIRKTQIEPIFTIQKVELDRKLLNFKIDSFESYSDNKQNLIKYSGEAAGFFPFKRGVSASMYALRPWLNLKISSLESEKKIVSIDGNYENNQEEFIAEIIIKGIELLRKTPNYDLVFSFKIDGEHFQEIAKLRSSRVLWAIMIKELYPENDKQMAMQIHCEISGETLEEKTLNSLSAIFGGTQSLDVNDNIHKYLVEETFISKVIDPWGGSFVVENLTDKIINNTLQKIRNRII